MSPHAITRRDSGFSLTQLEKSPEDKHDFGAVVEGLDLNSITDADVKALADAIWIHKVVVVKGQKDLAPIKQWELVTRFDPEAPHVHSHGDIKSFKKKGGVLSAAREVIGIPSAENVRLIGKGYQGAGHYGIKDKTIHKALSHDFHAKPLPEPEFAAGFTRFQRWHMDAPLYGRDPAWFTTLRCCRRPHSVDGKPVTIRWDDGSGFEMKSEPGLTAFFSNVLRHQHAPALWRGRILACSSRLLWNAEDLQLKHASVASPELLATSKGIKIQSYILPQAREPFLFFLPLNCRDEGCDEEWGFLIRHLGGGVFARARSWTLVTDPRSRKEKRDTFHLVESIYLANLLPLEAMSALPSLHRHAFRMTRLRVLEKTLKKSHWPPRYYDTMRHLWITHGLLSPTACCRPRPAVAHGLLSPTYCVSFYDGPVHSKLVMEPWREHLKLQAYFGCIDNRDPWICLAGLQTASGLLSYDNKLDDDLLSRVGWRAVACQYHTARIVSEGKDFDIRAGVEEVMLDGEPIWQISFDVTYIPSLNG